MNTTEELVPEGSSFLKKFDPNVYEFLNWENHFEFIVDFVQITDDKKVEFLLNLLEPLALTAIREKVFPYNPFHLSYEVLISTIEKLYTSYEAESAASFRFWCRNQIYSETLSQYVLALRKIASKCSSYINSNEYLIIRFINGIANKEARKLLRNVKNLTFTKAIAIAQRMELEKISLLMNSLL